MAWVPSIGTLLRLFPSGMISMQGDCLFLSQRRDGWSRRAACGSASPVSRLELQARLCFHADFEAHAHVQPYRRLRDHR
jgi:hypothetical protein